MHIRSYEGQDFIVFIEYTQPDISRIEQIEAEVKSATVDLAEE